MRVAEIFYSIQGEGILVGVPSVFIRVSGCNLRCTWCDTPYASWDPEGEVMSVDKVLETMAEVSDGDYVEHVVLTGGEPMIFPDIVDLTRSLKSRGHHITIETAGTKYQPVECDLMSISPKLSNSLPPPDSSWYAIHDRLRIQYDVLRQLMNNYNYQLKFVVSQPGDLSEISVLVSELGADRGRVLLMPEGRTHQELVKRSRWLVELCKATGYRFSPRLHVDIYGNRRGV